MSITVKSLAPILLVEDIAPNLGFWVDRLGFTVTTTVPEQAPFDFAIVARDGVEVMLQTRASAGADLGAEVPAGGGAAVYVSVAALDPVIDALGDAEVVVARRTTFYGADEIFVRDPDGNLIGFAAFG